MTATVRFTEHGGADASARPRPADRRAGDGPAARPHPRPPPASIERAVRILPFGVVSSFQKMQPYPIYADPREGEPRLGPGRAASTSTSTAASAPWWWGTPIPASSRRSHEAASRGTHFAVTTEEAVAFGEEICRRFNLEMLRFANSGTEATMDAIRVARAATGRDVVCKIEGSYHGHHDAVMFSVVPNADVMGGRERPAKAPVSKRAGEGRATLHRGGALQRRRRRWSGCSPSRARRSPASSWSRR